MTARRRWLIGQGLAKYDGEALVIDRKRLTLMERDAIAEAGERLSRQIGKEFVDPVEGERVSGTYRHPVDLPTGRFAVVEKSKEFTLVPWREALEARRGMGVSGIMRRGGVTWDFGKARGGPARYARNSWRFGEISIDRNTKNLVICTNLPYMEVKG